MKTINSIIRISLLSFVLVYHVQAQTGKFYLGVHTGYSLPLIKQPTGTDIVYRSTTPGSFNMIVEEKAIYSNLGSGFNAGFNAGYVLNENMAVEFGVQYIRSSSSLVGRIKSFSNSVLEGESESYTESTTLNFCPTLRFFRSYSSGQLFFRMAPLFGLTYITLSGMDKDYTTAPDELQEGEVEISGNLSYGLFASAGYTMQLSSHIGLAAELFSNLQHYVPSKAIMTKSTLNGVDELAGMKKSEKEIEFVDEATIDSSAGPSDTSASKMVKDKQFSFLLSGVGIQLSLYYTF
jgi:hypothetical protein